MVSGHIPLWCLFSTTAQTISAENYAKMFRPSIVYPGVIVIAWKTEILQSVA